MTDLSASIENAMSRLGITELEVVSPEVVAQMCVATALEFPGSARRLLLAAKAIDQAIRQARLNQQTILGMRRGCEVCDD